MNLNCSSARNLTRCYSFCIVSGLTRRKASDSPSTRLRTTPSIHTWKHPKQNAFWTEICRTDAPRTPFSDSSWTLSAVGRPSSARKTSTPSGSFPVERDLRRFLRRRPKRIRWAIRRFSIEVSITIHSRRGQKDKLLKKMTSKELLGKRTIIFLGAKPQWVKNSGTETTFCNLKWVVIVLHCINTLGFDFYIFLNFLLLFTI